MGTMLEESEPEGAALFKARAQSGEALIDMLEYFDQLRLQLLITDIVNNVLVYLGDVVAEIIGHLPRLGNHLSVCRSVQPRTAAKVSAPLASHMWMQQFMAVPAQRSQVGHVVRATNAQRNDVMCV